MPSSFRLMLYTCLLNFDWYYKYAFLTMANPIQRPPSLRLILNTAPIHYVWLHTEALFTTTETIQRTSSLKWPFHFDCSITYAFFISTDHIHRPYSIRLILYSGQLRYICFYTQALFTMINSYTGRLHSYWSYKHAIFTETDLIHWLSSLRLILYTGKFTTNYPIHIST